MPSFSIQRADLEQESPIVEVEIAPGVADEQALARNTSKSTPPLPVLAMIDTSAAATVIKQDLISRLGLQPVGTVLINTPSSTRVDCYQYLLRSVLPNDVALEIVGVGAPLEGQSIQCLIGRDVLRQSVLIYTGHSNTFTLCF